MLNLSRKEEESITFPGLGITVFVKNIMGNRVVLGVDAPKDIIILRSELDEDSVRNIHGRRGVVSGRERDVHTESSDEPDRTVSEQSADMPDTDEQREMPDPFPNKSALNLSQEEVSDLAAKEALIQKVLVTADVPTKERFDIGEGLDQYTTLSLQELYEALAAGKVAYQNKTFLVMEPKRKEP
jgi:carbon storage regulator CsrA